MPEIKIDINTFERPIKIQRWAFDALFKMCTMWHHLGGPSMIYQSRLNRNDLHPSISS